MTSSDVIVDQRQQRAGRRARIAEVATPSGQSRSASATATAPHQGFRYGELALQRLDRRRDAGLHDMGFWAAVTSGDV
jgi:hypothetical protein